MTDTVADHAALRDEIEKAKAAENAAFHRMWAVMPGEGYQDALAEWQKASARHSALIEAGLILTLGTGENTDGELQPQ